MMTMIKFTLLALLVLIHSSTSKRLLLQTVAEPAVVEPAPANPSPAVVDPLPANPSPANPSPATPAVNPGLNQQQPGLLPGQGQNTGFIPPPPIEGVANANPLFQPPQLELNCVVPSGLAGSCAMRRRGQTSANGLPCSAANPCGPLELNNIAHNFKGDCSGFTGCYGSQFDINVGANYGLPMGVQKIHSWKCGEPYSCMYATINVRNMQNNGNNIEFADLDCQGLAGCNDLTINLWGTSMNDISCPDPQNCVNCWIQFFRLGCNDPNNPACMIERKPCWGY